MPRDLIGASLRLLERETRPPPGVADALFARLLTELEAGTAAPSETSVEAIPTRPGPGGARRWGPALLAPIAAALVALVVGVTVVTDVLEPRSALAVVEQARLRFVTIPPFEAEVVHVQPVDDIAGLPSDLGAAGLPNLEIIRHVRYVDGTHWQVTVQANSYVQNPELDPALTFMATERPGDWQIADGELVGTYGSGAHRYLVAPLSEHDPTELRSRATGGLAPYPDQQVTWLTDADLERYCTVGDDVTVVGRRAIPIVCAPRGGDPSLFITVDADTGLLLRLESTLGDRGQPLDPPHLIEVRSLTFGDVDPTFEIVPPVGARVVWTGQAPAPDAYRIESDSGIADTFPVEPVVWTAVAGDDGLFVLSSPRDFVGTDPPPRNLSRLDPATGRTLWRAAVDRNAGSLAVGGGYVWLAGTADTGVVIGDQDASRRVYESFLYRYDPDTGDRVGEPLVIDDSDNGAVIVADGEVWFTGGTQRPAGRGARHGTLLRLDPDTLTTLQQLPLDITIGWWPPVTSDGSLWILGWPTPEPGIDHTTHAIEIDLRTGDVAAPLQLPDADPSAFTAADGTVWATTSTVDVPQQTLYRLDPASGDVSGTATIGAQPAAMLVADQTLWIIDHDDATLRSIDVATLQVLGEVTIGGQPHAISTDDSSLWIADRADGAVKRVPLR